MRTKVFLNNRTQAVRLPTAVALPGGVTEVEITAVGDARLIVPVRDGWGEWWDDGARATPDFMTEREEPEAQERAW